MFEKVNPGHPDKIADRIAGALVDLAYKAQPDPKIAVEVLIGHGVCHIIAETSVRLQYEDVHDAVERIAGNVSVDYIEVPQDRFLAANQIGRFRCGDNGIFKGTPVTDEQNTLCRIAHILYERFGCDGKYIIDGNDLVICQSNATWNDVMRAAPQYSIEKAYVNPLGCWTGGLDVDTGATNRKLGSDMGDSVTGGGLHGKDLSKADVSLNIFAWLEAQRTGKTVELCCAIGDDTVGGIRYADIVEIARDYITRIGGFEKFAEWGLVR